MMKISMPGRLLALFAFLLFSGCGTKENSVTLQAGLDAYFSHEFLPDQPGGAVLVMRNDSILFSKGYGLADLKTKEPVTTQTLFNIGSITKTFVANAILMLQEQGRLSMEDSLIRYFPEFKNKVLAGKIKIKHLLTHTSGLPDNRKVWKDTAFYLTARDEENWKPEMEVEQLHFEPGSRFEYSNPAFNGLALIVEKVSGVKWQTFIEQNIMRPSGMALSTITDGPHPETGVSHAYVLNHGQWTEDDYGEEPTFPASGNGGVWSSVEELARYEKAIQQAKFLKPETILDSRTIKQFPSWNDTIPARAGWSWINPARRNPDNTIRPFIGWSWFISETADGAKLVGHTGSQGGFLCNYVSIPEKKIFFVILCNTPRDMKAFSEKIMSALSL